MDTTQIISEINHLSLADKLYIMEIVLHSIREDTQSRSSQLEKAAALLSSDYKEDKELTAFTALDGESFYETK